MNEKPCLCQLHPTSKKKIRIYKSGNLIIQSIIKYNIDRYSSFEVENFFLIFIHSATVKQFKIYNNKKNISIKTNFQGNCHMILNFKFY